jgi:hypothetical protein
MPHYELLDKLSPQYCPMKKMINILTDFRAHVVEFVFGVRNSGQKETKAGARHQLLRRGSWVATSSETARMQVCPSNWIRSAE